jgi:hypothetical protein
VTGHWSVPVSPAQHPVLVINPRSGGGKAERFGLIGQCRARGIEPVILEQGADLVELLEEAVADVRTSSAWLVATALRARSRAWSPGTGLPWSSCRRARGTTWIWISVSTGGTSWVRWTRSETPVRGGWTSPR